MIVIFVHSSFRNRYVIAFESEKKALQNFNEEKLYLKFCEQNDLDSEKVTNILKYLEYENDGKSYLCKCAPAGVAYILSEFLTDDGLWTTDKQIKIKAAKTNKKKKD
jgi:hypothetical protein